MYQFDKGNLIATGSSYMISTSKMTGSTSGLAGVAKIASQKFEGGGSATGGGGASEGGGGGMSGGTQAPSFNVVGNNGLNQLSQLQQQPTQAYVVSGQVTTAQSLDRNRIQNATL